MGKDTVGKSLDNFLLLAIINLLLISTVITRFFDILYGLIISKLIMISFVVIMFLIIFFSPLRASFVEKFNKLPILKQFNLIIEIIKLSIYLGTLSFIFSILMILILEKKEFIIYLIFSVVFILINYRFNKIIYKMLQDNLENERVKEN